MSGDDDAPQGAFASLLDSAGDILTRFLGNALQSFESGDVTYHDYTFGDGWRMVSSTRPVEITVPAQAVGENGNQGRVTLQIDDNGDGSFDKILGVAHAQASGLASNPRVEDEGSATVTLPPGGQYQVVNQDDPAAANSVFNIREVAK